MIFNKFTLALLCFKLIIKKIWFLFIAQNLNTFHYSVNNVDADVHHHHYNCDHNTTCRAKEYQMTILITLCTTLYPCDMEIHCQKTHTIWIQEPKGSEHACKAAHLKFVKRGMNKSPMRTMSPCRHRHKAFYK